MVDRTTTQKKKKKKVQLLLYFIQHNNRRINLVNFACMHAWPHTLYAWLARFLYKIPRPELSNEMKVKTTKEEEETNSF